MTSSPSFHTFARPKPCPVPGRIVVVSGIEVPLHTGPQIVRKACSNSGECISKFGAVDVIPNCLLNDLSPATR